MLDIILFQDFNYGQKRMRGDDACDFDILSRADVYMCINTTSCLSKVAPKVVVRILLFAGWINYQVKKKVSLMNVGQSKNPVFVPFRSDYTGVNARRKNLQTYQIAVLHTQ